MPGLAQLDTLLVRQKKEWGEILTGFEMKNKYSILDPEGAEIYLAAEESGFLGRWFLKSARPFTMHIFTPSGQPVLNLVRPFKFIFYRIDIFDGSGTLLGSVVKRWAFFRRVFSVLNTAGNEIFRIVGPFFRPWTFLIHKEDREVGKISKQWGGILREAFTDADQFGVQFPPGLDVQTKSILLGAVFLIDFAYFEQH